MKTLFKFSLIFLLLHALAAPAAITVTNIAQGMASHSLFFKSDGSLWAMGYNNYGQLGDGTYSNTNQPEEIVASDVTAVTVGYGDSLFLKSDGSLWGMGHNTYGELGDSTVSYGTNQPDEIISSGARPLRQERRIA